MCEHCAKEKELAEASMRGRQWDEHLSELPKREGRIVTLENGLISLRTSLEDGFKTVEKNMKGYAVTLCIIASVSSFIGGLMGRACPSLIDMFTKSAFAESGVIKKAVTDATEAFTGNLF
jgi:hypothetical protein